MAAYLCGLAGSGLSDKADGLVLGEQVQELLLVLPHRQLETDQLLSQRTSNWQGWGSYIWKVTGLLLLVLAETHIYCQTVTGAKSYSSPQPW